MRYPLASHDLDLMTTIPAGYPRLSKLLSVLCVSSVVASRQVTRFHPERGWGCLADLGAGLAGQKGSLGMNMDEDYLACASLPELDCSNGYPLVN